MQGNVIGLIELEPLPSEGPADLFSASDDATLADAMRRLAHEEGPVAVDNAADDFADVAQLFAAIEAPPSGPRWSQPSGFTTRLSIDRAALIRDLEEELTSIVERLLSASR